MANVDRTGSCWTSAEPRVEVTVPGAPALLRNSVEASFAPAADKARGQAELDAVFARLAG